MSYDAVALAQRDIDAITLAIQGVTVTPSKRQYVVGRSEAVGWTDFRRAKRLSARTRNSDMANLQLVTNDVIRRCFPNFEWTTLMVNSNTQAVPHKDKGNVGNSVAVIIMPTKEDDDANGCLVYTDGDAYEVVGRPGQAVMFSGQREHTNMPFKGVRYSIIAFHHKSFARADDAARQQLACLGYQLPAAPSRGSDPSGAAGPSRGSDPSGEADPSPSRGTDPSGEGGADDDDEDDDADEDVWGDDEDADAPAADLVIPVTNYTEISDYIQYKVYNIGVRSVVDGVQRDVPVYQGMPIEAFRTVLKDIFGIAERDQMIAYCGEYLEDGKLIGDYFVEDGWMQVAFLAKQ